MHIYNQREVGEMAQEVNTTVRILGLDPYNPQKLDMVERVFNLNTTTSRSKMQTGESLEALDLIPWHIQGQTRHCLKQSGQRGLKPRLSLDCHVARLRKPRLALSCVAEGDLELATHLPHPVECWDYRNAPSALFSRCSRMTGQPSAH